RRARRPRPRRRTAGPCLQPRPRRAAADGPRRAHQARRARPRVSVPLDEAAAVFGCREVVAVEPLGHGTPAATAGVWRVRTDDDCAVLKVVRHDPDGAERWPSSEVESDPYYWRHEPLAYASGLLDSIEPLRAPRCRLCRERADGTVALWLEDVATHPEWTVGCLRRIAYDLGRMQGRKTAALP